MVKFSYTILLECDREELVDDLEFDDIFNQSFCVLGTSFGVIKKLLQNAFLKDRQYLFFCFYCRF
jgi:hypothetical protein